MQESSPACRNLLLSMIRYCYVVLFIPCFHLSLTTFSRIIMYKCEDWRQCMWSNSHEFGANKETAKALACTATSWWKTVPAGTRSRLKYMGYQYRMLDYRYMLAQHCFIQGVQGKSEFCQYLFTPLIYFLVKMNELISQRDLYGVVDPTPLIHIYVSYEGQLASSHPTNKLYKIGFQC